LAFEATCLRKKRLFTGTFTQLAKEVKLSLWGSLKKLAATSALSETAKSESCYFPPLFLSLCLLYFFFSLSLSIMHTHSHTHFSNHMKRGARKQIGSLENGSKQKKKKKKKKNFGKLGSHAAELFLLEFTFLAN